MTRSGTSERFNQNLGKKQNTSLNVSTDIKQADLLDKKNTNENSPKLTRNQSNLGKERDRSVMGVMSNNDNEKAVVKENMTQIEQNPLSKRIFTHVAQTSTAIQVAWSHPANFQKVLTFENENGQKVTQK